MFDREKVMLIVVVQRISKKQANNNIGEDVANDDLINNSVPVAKATIIFQRRIVAGVLEVAAGEFFGAVTTGKLSVTP